MQVMQRMDLELQPVRSKVEFVEFHVLKSLLAWCLSWSFLNAKTTFKSMRPVPIALLGAVTLNTVIYGKKTLQVNGYI